ncbi:hypothetical protein B0H13DRAFT_1972329, partial [Mycena leptocephala]
MRDPSPRTWLHVLMLWGIWLVEETTISACCRQVRPLTVDTDFGTAAAPVALGRPVELLSTFVVLKHTSELWIELAVAGRFISAPSLGEASAGAWGRLHDSSSCDNDESN